MTIIFSLSPEQALVSSIAKQLNVEVGSLEYRQFPDGETYLRIHSEVDGHEVIIVNDLHFPNQKTLDLILLANTLRSLGVKRVGLVAPYLAYMRQDMVFNKGEGISSHYYAKLLSQHFDWLMTVDPHLHRIDSLDQIYNIPTICLHATKSISDWLQTNVEKPLIIGPDSESEQWVKAIGYDADIPFEVLEKIRHGDREVSISVPHLELYRDHTPVLIDDIISTGRTMIETAQQLKQLGMNKPVCIGVHAVLADGAIADMNVSYIEQVVTCNTIGHDTNGIDLSGLFSSSIADFLKK